MHTKLLSFTYYLLPKTKNVKEFILFFPYFLYSYEQKNAELFIFKSIFSHCILPGGTEKPIFTFSIA